MASRSRLSDEKDTGVAGENARNIHGKLSKGSKKRRKKRRAETTEGLVKGLRDNMGHLPRKGFN